MKLRVDNHNAHKSTSFQLIFFAALLAFYDDPNKTLASCRGHNPGMIRPGWIVAHVALMAALEHGDPVAEFILVETDNLLLDLAGIHEQSHYICFSNRPL
jgi:hypothetical protein